MARNPSTGGSGARIATGATPPHSGYTATRRYQEGLKLRLALRQSARLFCGSAPCARLQRLALPLWSMTRRPVTEAVPSRRSRAQGALPQKSQDTALRCAAQRREPDALDRRAPCAAVRGGRSGPQGDRHGCRSLFDRTRMSCRKARPLLTDWPALPASAKRGCPFFGLLLFGQAKKSDPASGRRPEARRRRARSRQRHVGAKEHGH